MAQKSGRVNFLTNLKSVYQNHAFPNCPPKYYSKILHFMNTHFFKSSYLNTDTENRRDDPRTHEKLPIEKNIYLKTYKHSHWNGFFSELMDIIEINLR